MIDDVVASLARELYDGDLCSVLPLIDRLHETGDSRWLNVANALDALREGKEEMRHESSSVRIYFWRSFQRALKRSFSLELNGPMTLDDVRELAALIDPKNLPEEYEPVVGPGDALAVGEAETVEPPPSAVDATPQE